MKIVDIKNQVAKNLGYTDFEEMICTEESPINPEDISKAIDEVCNHYLADWNLSREKKPDFDGFYYVYGFMHHSCGNVTPFHKIVECKMNQWVKSDVGEQMTYWRQLLETPAIKKIDL